MKSITTMSPHKRERYAQWLRNTGVEHPSDKLIDKTREPALLRIDEAKKKAHHPSSNWSRLFAAVWSWRSADGSDSDRQYDRVPISLFR